MVFAELTSGLGNQLFQYAAARAVAIKQGERLVLDNRFFFHNKYRSPKLIYFKTGAFMTLPSVRWGYCILEKILTIRKRSVFNVNEEKWWEFQSISDIANDSQIRLKGGWCSLCYFESYSSIIKKEISIKKRYSKRIVELKNKIKKNNSVAIHIRKGDYIDSSDAAEIFFNLDIDYYAKAVKYIKDKVNDPVFYIFSNDTEWVAKNFHPMFSEPFEDISSLYLLEDYEEFELMRSCKNQIIANSTFSWWAAFLNDYDKKIIIQPKQWFKYPPANENYEKGLLIGDIGIKL